MTRHDEWSEPAMRVFGAYWDEMLGTSTSEKTWKDDQRFADRLEEMTNELKATLPNGVVGIRLEHLDLIVENIRDRARK